MAKEALTFQNLTGVQKTAIFLLAMGESYIEKVFMQISDDEVRDISIAMANLGSVDAHLVEEVLQSFCDTLEKPSRIKSSFEGTARILNKVLPQKRSRTLLEEIRGPAGRTTWDKLDNVNEEVLANYLQNEYPQTVAVILSKISAEQAAKILSHLPESFALEVVMRLMRSETVPVEIVNQIEQTLKDDFMLRLTDKMQGDSSQKVAEIFASLDRTTENKLMTALFECNREMAEDVRSKMFTFEDIIRLDDKSIQLFVRSVDRSQLALALKGASETLKEIIFKNMSEKGAMMLGEDLQALGAVRLRDVDAAQATLVQVLKQMMIKGDVRLLQEASFDEMVE